MSDGLKTYYAGLVEGSYSCMDRIVLAMIGRASVEHAYRHSLADFRLLTPSRNRSTDSKDRFFQKRAQYPWRGVELAWAHPTILDSSE
jgi:hypothetical protein